jgi:hypothetical protein
LREQGAITSRQIKDAAMRRMNAVPGKLVDVLLIAGFAATGMILVFGLIYVTTALGRIDPLSL